MVKLLKKNLGMVINLVIYGDSHSKIATFLANQEYEEEEEEKNEELKEDSFCFDSFNGCLRHRPFLFGCVY